jgi:hypothetical protein
MTVFMSHAQVNNRQHHKDERLQRDDQNVENGPGYRQRPLCPEWQQGDQDKDQLTGVEVTEQTQCQ